MTKGKRVAICGLVRNCKEAVVKHWEALQGLEADGTQISWIFVENDSVDGSREWLDDLAGNNPNVTVMGENIREPTIPVVASGQVMPAFSISRISKMAIFRNIYLEHVKRKIGLENLDAVIVVDYDVYSLPVGRIREILCSLSPDEVFTALGTAYSRPLKTLFYDCYAYREKGATAPQTYDEIDGQRVGLWRRFTNQKYPVEVDSNFNGCAIYPAATLRDLRYEVIPNDDPQVECFVEHVGLHEQMNQLGIRILLDPSLRVRYETPLSYWSAWIGRRLRKNHKN